MTRFIEGVARDQVTLLPEVWTIMSLKKIRRGLLMHSLRCWTWANLGSILNQRQWGSSWISSRRDAADLSVRIGYLNQVQSSRRLERECGRNLELIWLTGRLKPDFKTIADFRKDNGPAIRQVCQQLLYVETSSFWTVISLPSIAAGSRRSIRRPKVTRAAS